MVRQVQVLKMRGNAPQPGLHTLRISDEGVRAFPRMLKPIEEAQGEVTPRADLDRGRGARRDARRRHAAGERGCSWPARSGSGKTTMGVQFVAEGCPHGEPGVVVMFEETTPKYLDQAKTLGVDLQAWPTRDMLEVVYVRPLDLSMDETLYAIQTAVDKVGARRVVLDSISGLEAALAPAFKEDFLESLYRLLGALTGVGHHDPADGGSDGALQRDAVHAAPDLVPHPRHRAPAVLRNRGELRTFMTVIKTSARAHSRELRAYEVTSQGIVVGEPLAGLSG